MERIASFCVDHNTLVPVSTKNGLRVLTKSMTR